MRITKIETTCRINALTANSVDHMITALGNLTGHRLNAIRPKYDALVVEAKSTKEAFENVANYYVDIASQDEHLYIIEFDGKTLRCGYSKIDEEYVCEVE